MCVDIERYLRSFGRKSGEAWDADRNFISHTGSFQDQVRWMFFKKASTKVSNHLRKIVNVDSLRRRPATELKRPTA